MNLTPELVDFYKKCLTNPKGNELKFPAISEIFQESNTAIAKHLVFEKYLETIKKPIPKLIFYIIMDEIFPQKKAEDGNIGYCLSFIPDSSEEDFWVECNVCKSQLKNWSGSTPCCGSIAYIVEDGKPTGKLSLFVNVKKEV